MRKIKVMHLLSPMTVAGAERVVLLLLKSINRSKFDVSVCLFINTNRRENPFQNEVSKLKLPIEIIYLDKIFRWGYVKTLRDLLKSHAVEILHTHSHRADITGFLGNQGWGGKLVSTVHGWTSSTGKVRIYEWLGTRVLKRFDRVIAVSDDIRNNLIRHNIDRNRIEKLHNVIDMSAYNTTENGAALRIKLGVGRQGKLIGTVGRLSREKGLDQFLRVAQRIRAHRKDTNFVIVGDGPDKDRLIKIRDELGLKENVSFVGYVQNVSSVYSALDLFLLTSLSEGIPISLLEAAYFGKPCIATAVGGVPEVLDGVGRLTHPGDVDSMTREALYFLDHESEAKAYSERIRNHLILQFNPNQWIRSIEDVYCTLIEGHDSGTGKNDTYVVDEKFPEYGKRS